jgi:hypothetical protein
MIRDVKTRKGYEWWDKFCAIPRFSFLLSPSGNSIQKFENTSGNWVDQYEASKVMDEAQDFINALEEKLEIATKVGESISVSAQNLRDRLTLMEQRVADKDAEIVELEKIKRPVPRRMWVNQPSTLQPLHKRHGENVIAVLDYKDTYRCYPISGEVSSFQCRSQSLSEGWTGDYPGKSQ